MFKTICSFFQHLWHIKHSSLYSTYWATFDTFNMSNITLYWEPCMHFQHLQHAKYYSPYSTYWATFDTFNISNITLYWGPCMYFRHLQHNSLLIFHWYYSSVSHLWHLQHAFSSFPHSAVFGTFDTSDIKESFNLNVDSNSKYLN